MKTMNIDPPGTMMIPQSEISTTRFKNTRVIVLA